MKKRLCLLLALALLAGIVACPAMASEYYSEYTPIYNASSGMLSNIRVAADALDGVYVPYGSSFSFNDLVGPRTKARGYVTAANGRGAKVVGGGVAQVATTLYLALLQLDGIRYDEVSTYGKRFTGSYVSDGALAIVTDYNNGTDFAFTNFEDDMVIRFWTDANYLYCELELDSGNGGGGYVGGGSVLLGSSGFPLNGSSGLINNVTRAADSITGTRLGYGDTFSFNSIVGARTKERGYVSAINGRGAKVVGGGVAQVASVIWLAVKNESSVTVTEKTNYGQRYNQSYVSNYSDAVATDYNAGTDFCFRYFGSGTLVIYTYVENGYLWCDLYEETGTSYLSW